MAAVKRALLAILLVAVCAAGIYGSAAARRERNFRQLVNRGEVALARDDTFAAIESFSGAIALKDDSMLGYLKRGEAYRRRQTLDAPARDPHHVPNFDAPPDAAMRHLLSATQIEPLGAAPPWNCSANVN